MFLKCHNIVFKHNELPPLASTPFHPFQQYDCRRSLKPFVAFLAVFPVDSYRVLDLIGKVASQVGVHCANVLCLALATVY